MQNIFAGLYLGKCNECNFSSRKGRTLIYTCHWPCRRSDNPIWPILICPGQELSRRSDQAGRVYFHSLQNMEIPRYQPQEVNRILDQIDCCLRDGEVCLISEQGGSRAATLALLWLAKRSCQISRSSFAAARSDFTRLFPGYTPWPGWVIFCEQEWDTLQ